MVDVDETDPNEEREQLIEAIEDNLSGVYGQIADLGFEVDNYLAEYRYDAVQEAIDAVTGLVDGGDVDDVEELAALRTDSAEQPAASTDVVKVEIPRLTAHDLPVIAEPTSDDDYHELVDSLRDREGRCADHIRKLFDCAERIWQQATVAAQAGQVSQVDETLRVLRQVPAELTDAYSLWELCLVDLYKQNPANLGQMGEMVGGFETWLAQHQNR